MHKERLLYFADYLSNLNEFPDYDIRKVNLCYKEDGFRIYVPVIIPYHVFRELIWCFEDEEMCYYAFVSDDPVIPDRWITDNWYEVGTDTLDSVFIFFDLDNIFEFICLFALDGQGLFSANGQSQGQGYIMIKPD